ncbi:MAG TPA: PAS domain-containing protein [Gemmatimonadaceae bacterium]
MHDEYAIIAKARELDTGSSAVIATNIAGAILYWNDAAEHLYGWRSDEVIGHNVVDVMPTHTSAQEAMHIMEKLRAGEEWHGSFIVRRRDGSPVLADVRDVPVIGPETVIGVVGMSRRLRG